MVCLERRSPLAAVILARSCALPLSARERELAVLLALGHPPAAAAARMAISLATLRTYAKSVYARCGVNGREGLVAFLWGT
jgi:DNA-binding CsgD family transcriptional regulator